MPSSLHIDHTYPRETIRSALRAIDLFDGMTDTERDAIADAITALRPDKAAIFACDGDPSDGMYLIIGGGVRVLPGGIDLGIVLPPGAVIGEMNVFDEAPFSATLAAADDGPTVLGRLDWDSFFDLFGTARPAARRVLRNVAGQMNKHLRDTNSTALEEAVQRERAEGEVRQAAQTPALAPPQPPSSFGDTQFHVHYTAARTVSGDYLEFIRPPDDPDRLIILYGDATGHGLTAALARLVARTAIHAQCRVDGSLCALMSAANDALCDMFQATLFMKFVAVEIDRREHLISHTNAGMQETPMLCRAGTDEFVSLTSQTFQLGIRSGAEYGRQTIRYEPGDLLVCCSAGMAEAQYCPEGADQADRNQEFGPDRLHEIVRQNAQRAPRSVREAVRSEGDAQTVRQLASLRREGMPEELLVKAFQACLDAYTPEVDRLRSPFVHSLVWFQPWIESAVDPWRRDRSHRRVLADQACRRGAVEREEESTLVPPLTSFAEFVERYSGRSILPPVDVLCAELDPFAGDVAAHHRDRGSSKREILDDVKR